MIKIKIIKRCNGYTKGETYVVPRTTATYLEMLKVAHVVETVKPKPKPKPKPKAKKK